MGSYAHPIEAWRGPPQTIVCDEFSDVSKGYGYRIEAAPAHPGLYAVGIPWASARGHRRELQRVGFAASFIVLTRDASSGRVRITRAGQPYFDYRPGAREKRLLKHGMVNAARIHFAAGAERMMTLHSSPLVWDRAVDGASIDRFCRRIEGAPTSPNRLPLFSAHQMGTCRMGVDPARAVCDGNGEVYGLKGAYVVGRQSFSGVLGC